MKLVQLEPCGIIGELQEMRPEWAQILKAIERILSFFILKNITFYSKQRMARTDLGFKRIILLLCGEQWMKG